MKNKAIKILASVCAATLIISSTTISTNAAINPNEADLVWNVAATSQPGWGKMTNVLLYDWKSSAPQPTGWTNTEKISWVNDGSLWQRLNAIKATNSNAWSDDYKIQQWGAGDYIECGNKKNGRCSRLTANFKLPENVWKYASENINFGIDGYQTDRECHVDDGYWVC